MRSSRTRAARRWQDPRSIVLLALLLILAPTASGAAPSISLSSSVISEGDDFATRVLGLPWDMSTAPYPDFATVFQGVDRASFSAAADVWSFTTTNNDPSLLLLSPGIQDTQRVLRLGDRVPIDTSKYKLLSFRLCSSAGSTANVNWFYDQAPHSVFASSNFVTIAATSGSNCAVYVIDMTQIGVAVAFGGATGWNGLIKGLRLDPVSTGSGISLQLDWVRLTTADTAHPVPINWADVTSGTNLFFYVSKDGTCSTTGATRIGSAARSGNSSGTFNWGSALQPNQSARTPFPLAQSLQPGQYAVFMRVDDTGAPICAAPPLDIRKAPMLSFQKPSFYSGPDYATEVVGHSWSMNSPTDVSAVSNLTSFDVSGGEFNGLTNSTGDPTYLMHVTTPIDTQRYKYLTFRMLLDGVQDIGAGWVHRVLWWHQGPTIDPTVSQDMIIYEGWQTYSMDLSQALIEPSSLGQGWTGAPIALRMDPDEMPVPMTFHVDFVTLTGDERVQTGSAFPIYYQTTPGSGVIVSLFYDTDTNPANGRTPLSLSTSPCPPSPAPELNLLTGTCVMWLTNGISGGRYFISADVSDGITTTTWYSEVPVFVNNPASHDFNGDGKADILWRHTSGALYTWFMNGTSLTSAAPTGTVDTSWTVQGTGDFNGDGKADILWRDVFGTVYIWLMNGPSVVGAGSPGSVTTDWTIQRVGDFNGDGKADILWRHSSGALYMWLMDGTSIIGAGSLGSVGTDWTIQGVGDFNGDGKADILWRHSSGALYMWLMDGTSIIGAASLDSVGTDWTIQGIGDFNGDGRADVLWRHSSGNLYIWLMNGPSISGAGSPGGVTPDWTIQGTLDFNGDGKADILWRHTSGSVHIWLMNGTSIGGAGSPGSAAPGWTIE